MKDITYEELKTAYEKAKSLKAAREARGLITIEFTHCRAVDMDATPIIVDYMLYDKVVIANTKQLSKGDTCVIDGISYIVTSRTKTWRARGSDGFKLKKL